MINTKNTRTEAQKEVMLQIKKDNICPFCEPHLKKYHTKNVNTFEYWHVTDNAYPYQETSHHKLLILKRHITNITDMYHCEWKELGNIIKEIVDSHGIAGGAVCFRFGDTELSGGTVEHLHAHVIEPGRKSKVRFSVGSK